MITAKIKSIVFLAVAQVSAMSLWFISSAVLPDMLRDFPISQFRQAAMASGVQAGFVIGALLSAFLGIADRYDPRRVFAACAIGAAIANAVMLIAEPGSNTTIFSRVLTGFLLAGVYPVGMKIAVGWGQKDRGLLVGILVGALTLGSAAPHLLALFGGADWHMTVLIATCAAILAGIICLLVNLGPYHAAAARFELKTVTLAWTDKRIRLAYAGYLGHMWELYAMWAWIAVAATASYAASLPTIEAEDLGTLTAFIAIGAGGVACAVAGRFADNIGKIEVTIIAMTISGVSALATAASFGGPVIITMVLIIVWGISIIPDSAQFSALVADYAPAAQAGSLMTFQTALGFALTYITVQLTPVFANYYGWDVILASMALGPVFGIYAMLKLRKMTSIDE